jgi:hypothetical protein
MLYWWSKFLIKSRNSSIHAINDQTPKLGIWILLQYDYFYIPFHLRLIVRSSAGHSGASVFIVQAP